MQIPDLPADEAARLDALRHYAILDTLPEQAYDDLLAVAAGICGTPMGSVSLVDAEREWYKAALGVQMREGPRAQSFCGHAILEPERLMVVEDATLDPRFCDNPRVTGEPHIRFYAGAPLVGVGGHVAGTLCVMDREPRQLTPFQRDSLSRLSRQVVTLLELRRVNRQLRQHLEERARYEQQLRDYQALLESHNQELSAQLGVDALTGLVSRRAFTATLEKTLSAAAMAQQPVALAVIDIDHFKAINDRYGHPVGDRVLGAFGQALRRLAPADAVPARQGGEEFVLLLPDTALPRAVALAEQLCAALREQPFEVPLTVSIGVAGWQLGESANALYARADVALYGAKRLGRNRVEAAAP